MWEEKVQKRALCPCSAAPDRASPVWPCLALSQPLGHSQEYRPSPASRPESHTRLAQEAGASSPAYGLAQSQWAQGGAGARLAAKWFCREPPRAQPALCLRKGGHGIRSPCPWSICHLLHLSELGHAGNGFESSRELKEGGLPHSIHQGQSSLPVHVAVLCSTECRLPSHPPWCSETNRQDRWCHGNPGRKRAPRGGNGGGGRVCRMGRGGAS